MTNKASLKVVLQRCFWLHAVVLGMGLNPEVSIAQSMPTSTWFFDDAHFSEVGDFVFRHAVALGIMEEGAAYRTIEERIDEDGLRHVRIQRTQGGYDVLGGDGWIHERRDGGTLFGGGYIPALESLPEIFVDVQTAVAIALAEGPPLPGAEWNLTDSAMNLVSASLVVMQRNPQLEWTVENTAVAYAVDMGPLLGSLNYVYVNASDGSVIRSVPFPGCSSGQAITLYNGLQNFWVNPLGSDYRLYSTCLAGSTIHSTYNEDDVLSSDLLWTTPIERLMASAHWAAEKTVDYFYDAHGRFGYNGSAGPLNVVISTNPDHAGALMGSPNYIVIGPVPIGASGPYASLDIVGHEFTHAIIGTGLSYWGESGALNESFADIFGTMVEAYAEPTTWNYYIGEDFWISGGKMRDMSNPKAKLHPDTYLGTYWYSGPETGNGESDEVHTNSGVPNYWFYLLSEGGSGINDYGYAYSVSGIGRNKAARIAYGCMNYMFSTANFSDAKNASIYAASELYGNCSDELLQTINAWNAVAVSSGSASIIWSSGPLTCLALFAAHNAMQPFDRFHIDDMTVDCAIIPNGTPVTVHAGESIRLLPGFASGDNFLAYIDPCLAPAWRANIAPIESGMAHVMSLEDNEPFHLYPNPTNGPIRLEWTSEAIEAKLGLLRVLDINGRLVREEQLNPNLNVDMDFSNEPAGTYLIELHREGRIYHERLILLP